MELERKSLISHDLKIQFLNPRVKLVDPRPRLSVSQLAVSKSARWNVARCSSTVRRSANLSNRGA